jgi:hypothetical protein
VNGATSYNVYWAAGSNVTTAEATKIAGATSPTLVNNIPQGVQYAFVVTAVNSAGESAASSIVPWTIATTTTHVYVAGSAGGYPVYWKDGVFHQIGVAIGYGASFIAVTANNVLVAGNQWSVTPVAPVYWNNGAMTLLPLPTGTTFRFFSGIAVSGTDVIICGTVNDNSGNEIPVYWDNGALTVLPIGADTQGYTGNVVVSSGHVYITGCTFVPNTDNNIVFWQDGVLNVLNQGANYGWGFTISGPGKGAAVMSGSDMYVFGTTYGPPAPGGGKPVYWKNGSAANVISMPGGTDYIAANMTLSGSDIYFAGSADQQPNDVSGVPIYWKNGTGTLLPLPNGVSNGSAEYIVVSGSDVYIAGAEVDAEKVYANIDPVIPLYWKNGALVSLPLPTGDPNARINGMSASGSDVYFSATTGTSNGNGDIDYNVQVHPVYWKNGSMNALPTGASTSGDAQSLAVFPN